MAFIGPVLVFYINCKIVNIFRNLHNESYVAVYEKGNVTMQGVDGSTNVFVKEGDVDIQVRLSIQGLKLDFERLRHGIGQWKITK